MSRLSNVALKGVVSARVVRVLRGSSTLSYLDTFRANVELTA
jgi:hypothetical protein